MEKINILCLHGFLGRPSDWDLIQSYFMVSKLAHTFNWWSVDVMNEPGLDPRNHFHPWSEHFTKKVLQKFPKAPRVLVGYSLGGRLALQALKARPDLYDQVILISTNPGLTREKDIADRKVNDQMWAEKFKTLPWPELLKQWNAQSVFKDSVAEPTRNEADYHREDLALALTKWSLAEQQDFRELIAQHAEKILVITGERDIKFLSLAMELKRKAPALQTETVGTSSHRVLFDNPGELAQKMISFVDASSGGA